MNIRFLISIISVTLLIGACSGTFLVYKDGYGSFVGSGSQVKYDILCASGDMEKVLADTSLETQMKDTLYKYNCSTERSSEMVKKIYASLTVEQRKDIKSAFRKNGYEINKMAC